MTLARAQQRYSTVLCAGAAAICLVAGIVCGASVFSDSRLACAVWVILAMVFTALAGQVFASSAQVCRSNRSG